jgi:RNA polymerase sigma-70 factor, ECF subfamily
MPGQDDPTGNGTGALASELFQQHSPMVLAICRRLLVDPAEAEDAMQQTYLSAYRSLLAGREPRQPAAWLASIARNECLNRIRAHTREPVAAQLSNGAAGSPDALNAAIASEDLRALGHTIKRLPAQQREALLLHEFCGLRYEEVAAAIGVSESAIGSLLFRARSRLRFLLQRAYGLVPAPWLWDLARAPGVKVAALPTVAKVGTAAVALSLATGTAVVVEREVEAPKKPAPPPPRVSPASVAPTGVFRATPVKEPVAETRSARPSPTTIDSASAGTHSRTMPRPKTVHKAHPTPTAVVAAEGKRADHGAPATPPGQTKKGSSSPSAHSPSVHNTTRSAKSKSKRQHSYGRSSEKVTPSRKADKHVPAKPVTLGSPNGNALGIGNGNANNTPQGNAGGSAEPQPQGNGSENVAAGGDQVGGPSTDHQGSGAPSHKER